MSMNLGENEHAEFLYHNTSRYLLCVGFSYWKKWSSAN